MRAACMFVLTFSACMVYILSQGELSRPPKPTYDGVDYHNLAVSLKSGEGYSHNWSDPKRKLAYLPFNSSGQQDGVDYHNLAVSLSKGEGYAHNWDDAERRRAYLRENATGEYTLILAQTGGGPTTKRPPGYPALLAVVYSIFGPWFGWARITNALFTAAAVAMATAYAELHGGWLAGVVAGGSILVADWLLIWSASNIMTESVSMFLIMLLLFLLTFATKKPTVWKGALIGSTFGFLVLVRANFLLWLPVVVVIGGFCTWKKWNLVAPKTRRQALLCFGVSLATTFVVLLPWWIRNCNTTGRFTPLGVLGTQSLAGAYSDVALRDWGNWNFEDESIRSAMSLPDFASANYAQREYLIGQQSQKIAYQWVSANYHWLPVMWIGRLVVLFHLVNVADLARFLLLPIGAFVVWKWPGGRFLVLAIIINAFVVSLTWSHEGRFLAPLRPFMSIAAGAAIWRLRQWVIAIKPTD